MIKFPLGAILFLSVFVCGSTAQKTPVLDELKKISELPAEVPKRANAIAFDGERFWVPLYLDRARFVTFDPQTELWDTTHIPSLRLSAQKVAGKGASPSGVVFVDKKMWIGGAYGDSYGWIEVDSPEKFKNFEMVIRPEWKGTQSYTDMAYDGTAVWASWLAGDYYNQDKSLTQMLLKIDKTTGKIESAYPIPFGGLSDLAHGLTWDGANLWYGFGRFLRVLDQKGIELRKYSLPNIDRISGLAFDGESLWIIEFDGKLWKLPLKETR